MSSKMGTGSNQSSVRPWLVQPIKELSSVAGLYAGHEHGQTQMIAIIKNF